MYLDVSLQLHNIVPHLHGISYISPNNFGYSQCEKGIDLPEN